ncbi:MAG: 2-C-methyl-D-erythritol 2,4-cyclodiphosphate synthase [Planctomycetes bacterium]|nr:2-C-methyl-D-erythritol 2,4-cyclodiphosphate synthase [Planctomycetota bacterium]
MSVGFGFDIHRLTAGRPLWLGGLRIDHSRGLEGHSDGDVLLHAVIDALLGAAGKGDIGDRFPDSDPKFRGIAGADMLASVLGDLKAWKIGIVDITLVAEEPKLGARKREIAEHVSRLLGGSPVNVKAKTAEGLGPVGHREAIACFAVVELVPRETP